MQRSPSGSVSHTYLVQIDTRDVAGAAVALLLLPSDKLGPYKAAGAFEVHGPQKLTFTEALKELGEVIGKPVELNYLEPEAWSKVLQVRRLRCGGDR